MPGFPAIVPDRRAVERVVREEARRLGVDVSDVLGSSKLRPVRLARTRAISRILTETGCSHTGLERVWGSRLRIMTRRARPAGFDDATRERLEWRYGEARTRQIINRQDPRTQRDVAAWRRLCAKANP